MGITGRRLFLEKPITKVILNRLYVRRGLVLLTWYRCDGCQQIPVDLSCCKKCPNAEVVEVGHAKGNTLYQLGDSGLRIYMGTDVRAGSLLAGAAAAMIWSRTRTDFSTSKVLKIAALISAIEILWSMYAFADPTFSISQQLAWPLTSIACAVAVIYMVELPHGRGGRWALHPVMQYIGKRSYGLYLWHYVWLTWFRGLGLLGVVMALGLSLLSAEMSWRLIEKPVSDWFRHKREEKKTQLAPDINITFEMAESRPSI